MVAVKVTSQEQPKATDTSVAQQHNSVEIRPGMSVEDYVSQSTRMHYGAKHTGIANGGLLQFSRKVGDMALAVIPKNRFWCAIGLTSGGFLGLKFGELLTGRNMNTQKEIVREYPKLLQPLQGLLKYDPHSSAPAERWKKVGGLFAFTAVSFAGVMTGAYYAYRNSRKRNETPNSLEDYAARAGEHQGDKWRWLAASSGVFGSTSGTYLLPYVPGVNYGTSIAAYTVLNQDRKVMTPGFKKVSGAKTMSYLGLREGVDYICKYAVNNPSKDPAELEFLTLTVMGPLADASGAKLAPQQIKTFVDKVHSVRDRYWQEGGIPRDQRTAALKAMETVFKGKGLDKTLYECGVDTARIDLTKLNGWIGKLGNSLGATKAILADQNAYRAKVAEWRKDWLPVPSTPATSAPEDSPAMIAPPADKIFASEDLKKAGSSAAKQRPASYREAINYADAGDVISSSL